LGRTATEFRIEVIPNWADTDLLQPICKRENPFAVQYDQADKVTVLYSGNMGHTHGLETIVESARTLEKDSRILFLLIGDGLGRRQIEEKVVAYGLANVKLLPRQPWNMLPYSLATGDIAIVTQSPGSEHLSVPSKTYSMMAAGCALVACTHEESDLARLVRANEIGVVCPHGDAQALAEAISVLAGDDRVLSEYRMRARKLAVERYSPQAVFARFCDVLVPAMSQVNG
jgi:glycosyltransferase involved in cell wall biosynthesis